MRRCPLPRRSLRFANIGGHVFFAIETYLWASLRSRRCCSPRAGDTRPLAASPFRLRRPSLLRSRRLLRSQHSAHAIVSAQRQAHLCRDRAWRAGMGRRITTVAGANGEIYDQNAMTAAHRTLPLNSMVRVTNLIDRALAMVRITDRGPFVGDRVIDLSLAAAKAVDVWQAGHGRGEAGSAVGARVDLRGRTLVRPDRRIPERRRSAQAEREAARTVTRTRR